MPRPTALSPWPWRRRRSPWKPSSAALAETEEQGLAAFLDSGRAGCQSGPYVGGSFYQKFSIVEPSWKYTKSAPVGEGRFTVTKEKKDKYLFKVPSVRKAAMASPYFHDGSVGSLEEAIGIMARVQLGKELDGVTLQALHAFLSSLTGTIPEDALRVPVLPPKE
jgi:cytochrome c peroxidase